MPITCPSGKKPRYRFRKTKTGKQRLAFCNNKVVEITPYKNSKKGIPKKQHLRTSKKGKKFHAGKSMGKRKYKNKVIKTEILTSPLSPHYSVYVTWADGKTTKHDFFTKTNAEKAIFDLKTGRKKR